MLVYEVTLTSELLDGPFVAEVMASTEKAAITRVKVAAMQSYRCVELLQSAASAKELAGFTS